MKNLPRISALASLLAAAGCQSHLIFVEENHVGLKAAFEPNNPSPVELSIAYRRGVVAVVPQQSTKEVSGTVGSLTVSRDGTTATVMQDPNELMSLYTRFRANVGLGDPISVHHFLATGSAASGLVANNGGLRDVVTNFNAASSPR